MEAGTRTNWTALFAMGAAVFVIANDFSAVNVALPTMESDFHTNINTIQWVVNAYALTFGVLIVTGGRLADMFGRRVSFFLGRRNIISDPRRGLPGWQDKIYIALARSAVAATDFYQILETSDVPDGVVNIVTGPHADLAKTLAQHDNLDALWYFGNDSAMAEKASTGNLKQTW